MVGGCSFVGRLDGAAFALHPAEWRDRESSSNPQGLASDSCSDLHRFKRNSGSDRAVIDDKPTVVEPARLRIPWSAFAWTGKSAAGVFLLSLALTAWSFFSKQSPVLTANDTIVLSDFVNDTGDAIFDDTLKQGLSMQLAQSRVLALLPDTQVSQALKLMGRSSADQLTPETTREICQRTNSTAMVIGSIAELANQYVIGVLAVDCNTAEVLALAQERASGKDTVLGALDAAAIALRRGLGESLTSLEQYNTPLAAASTSSLDALKAFSAGRKLLATEGASAALPFFKRAVDVDPNFAQAYTSLSVVYRNLNEMALAADCARKAYELRVKASERKRLFIEAFYD